MYLDWRTFKINRLWEFRSTYTIPGLWKTRGARKWGSNPLIYRLPKGGQSRCPAKEGIETHLVKWCKVTTGSKPRCRK